MGQAVNIVEKIMKDKNNYLKWGLIFPEYTRSWKGINLLVGENGSGKSRILQMIKENAKKECIVIYMDFARYVQLSYSLKKRGIDREEDTEESMLADKLIFRDKVEREIFSDFLKYLDKEIVPVLHELFYLENNNSKKIKNRVDEILNGLNPALLEILHRELKMKEDGIYLYKKNREVEIANEWEFLSPGERSILAIIFATLFIKLVDIPCILLIDEMETHLHPDAQVKLYKLLKQVLERTDADYCACIASHSVFLLPFFNIHEIVYMNNSEIRKINGGLYQQVYDNLVGEGEEESLTDFLYSISAWQYADYLAQCFLEPTIVSEIKSDDVQTLEFTEILKELYANKKKIEVLDFGAGEARIGKCLELMSKEYDEISDLTKKITYHIYDKYHISDEFEKNAKWYGKAYSSEKEIISANVKFDMILLYNVLHEIGVDEWVKELSFIFSLLKQDGYLVFGEREILSIGEKPYGKSGYLVLGKEELEELFPRMEIREILLPEKKKVTVCFVVKKPVMKIGNPTSKSVIAALKSLKNNTRDKIRNRDKNGLGEKGNSRKYAFYCQQYMNAEEAIDLMEGVVQVEEEQKQNLKTSSKEAKKNNVTLEDIIQANIPNSKRIEEIKILSQRDTEEGRKSRRYLVENKIS